LGIWLLCLWSVAGPIQQITDAGKKALMANGETEEVNEAAMRTWLAWHTVKTLLADMPALWCFAERTTSGFWIV
jgi:hypothetical protein